VWRLSPQASIVATGRHREAIRDAVGSDISDLLTLRLDVTVAHSLATAMNALMERLGRINMRVSSSTDFLDGVRTADPLCAPIAA